MTEKLGSIVEQLSALTALEISQLSKTLEEKWGVSAAVVASAAGAAPGAAAVVEEQTEFTVTLEAAGENKINVIKEIRTITGLGLKESKELVDGAPRVVKESIKKEEAESIKSKLEAAGAKVKLS
ncbi:MAG: 50S ribosomal protein L7/L12 [Rickettsiales bacterium]|jgi:large subunit ribosomal protein L7/L12|nr:50S ribosomal protein L7/L12 [Rickettsiales bacterium]